MGSLNGLPYDDPCDDDTPMPFGKHKGLALKDVPGGFLLWLDSKEGFREKNPGLADYIDANRDLLVEKKKAESKAYFEEKNRAAKDLTGKTVSFDED